MAELTDPNESVHEGKIQDVSQAIFSHHSRHDEIAIPKRLIGMFDKAAFVVAALTVMVAPSSSDMIHFPVVPHGE